jgi:hypothetical protein
MSYIGLGLCRNIIQATDLKLKDRSIMFNKQSLNQNILLMDCLDEWDSVRSIMDCLDERDSVGICGDFSPVVLFAVHCSASIFFMLVNILFPKRTDKKYHPHGKKKHN